MSCAGCHPKVRKYSLQVLSTLIIPFLRCFTQEDFGRALNKSKTKFEEMESLIGANLDYPGVLLTKNDAAFHHFETHDIDEDAFNNSRFAFILIDAFRDLENTFNMTREQVRFCMKTGKYSSLGLCKPMVVSCNPSTTR